MARNRRRQHWKELVLCWASSSSRFTGVFEGILTEGHVQLVGHGSDIF